MRVLLSGGGTAGHVYPALAVAATLAAEHDDVTFVGTPDGVEARLVQEAGIPFRGLRSKGFDRSKPLSFVLAVGVMLVSVVKAWAWLGREKPDVVMGFGGYVSLPVGLAAVARRIPLVLHEQNSVLGLANRVLARWATAIGVTYPESAESLRNAGNVHMTGNPVRGQMVTASGERGRFSLGIADDALLLLTFGGSRGARHLNQALVGLRARLMDIPELVVVQIAGPLEADSVRRELGSSSGPRWQVHDYVGAMGDLLAAADLVVCRAGATTIAELTAIGAPAIVVPYPFATDDHQTKNAAMLVSHGAAVLVKDTELDTPAFADEILRLLGDGTARANMAAASGALGRPDAAEHLVAMAREAVQG